MERNREGRRSAATIVGAVPSVTRRPRVKDISDDEERMDETVDTRSWERSKKERLTTFHVSSSMNARNKRKRQLLAQEPQAPGGRLNAVVEDADESVEETETQASEDDDEPPPPPLMRRPGPGKARVHNKDDDIVMEIPAVPRKARSSMSASSRYSAMARRKLESQHPETPRQKIGTPSQMPLNGSSSPSFLQKQGRKLKPVGPKVRAMKVPKVAEVSTLSDEEAEVAEALFDLSRSVPSQSNVLEAKIEVKLESEARASSPPTGHSQLRGTSMPHIHGLQHPVSTANGYVASHSKDVNPTTADAPKRKRPRGVMKSEDSKIATHVRFVSSVATSSSASPSMTHQSCVGETELTSMPEKVTANLASLPSEPVTVKGVTDPAVCEVKNHVSCETEGMEQGEFIAPKQQPQIVAKEEETMIDRSGEGADAAELVKGNDDNSTSELITRPVDTLLEDVSTAKLNIDLMASPLKHNAVEEDVCGSTIDRQNVGDNSFTISTSFDEQRHTEDRAKPNLVLEDAAKAMDIAGGLSIVKEKMDGVDHQLNDEGEQHVSGRMQMDQASTQSGQEEEEQGKELSAKTISRPQEEVSDNAAATPFVPSTMPAATSSSSPIPLSGWMGALPHLGYYGPGAPPWAAGTSLPNSGLDVKAARSAMQLPHGAVLPSPVQRMKRCATHVFVAHFIYRDQQISRQSLWSAALCRPPYNLNIPPVSILDNDKLGGHYLDAARKASAPQSGPPYAYTIAQGGGLGMAGGGTPGTTGMMPGANHVSGAAVSGDTGNTNVTGSSSNNAMAAHAQYLQAMMQQNGFAFPFTFSGPHGGQAPQFYNNPFFPHQLIHPPIPQVQALAQQSGNVLKQQQGVGSLPHSSSQLVAPLLQQQLQLQLAPQSPSQSQQPHNNVGMSAQQFGIHSDKETTACVESASTAESRLTSVQRSMAAQQAPSNLPNLNMSASPLMLGASVPGMPSYDQDGSSIGPPGGKHTGKAPSPFPSQNPSSLSSSMQPQQFTTGSATGLQMKVLDTTFSQGYSTLSRGSVNPGTLGLASSMMGTPNLGVLPVDGSKGSGQQQPVYGGHGLHFQRSLTKGPALDDAYVIKTRDYVDDKRNSIKPVGGSALISRVDMEVSSSSLQGSPTSGSTASNARMACALGRTINSGTPPDARSSRPVPSMGSGQLLQNQPPPKQAMGRAKTVSSSANVAANPVSSHSVGAYSERVPPGNLAKFPGTGLPYSGQIASSNQSPKPVLSGVAKAGQRMSPGPAQPQMSNPALTKNHVPQARSNQSSAPRMPHPVTTPVLPAGAISMSTPHSLSVSKASTVASSKSPSNGKGSMTVTKAGPLSKKPPVSGPATSSGLSPVQSNMSSRAPVAHKGPASAVHVPQFHQQQSALSTQQQRLPTTKIQVYQQLQAQQGQYKQPFQAQSPYRPQLFLQQHQQQYMQPQPSHQQQPMPQHQQAPVSQHYLPNPQSSSQHSQSQTSQPISHLQQQFQPVAGSNGLSLTSPNLTLATAVSGSITNSASLDGVGLKTIPTKTGYASANSLTSAGIPDVSGQVSSPISGSSSYLQLAAVKPSEQKPLASDVSSREDISGAKHLPSPSSSQAGVASNPSS